ncbi:type II toxin-antitoxin system RelE/ParE family toxin [Garicola koreensis]|uniref:Plasmid stabilization system protein ParE n=1 Tax=Garicola koreensis TaxID=1262554 RepID=A0A7W5XZY7_9MICC|nr:plasmid stabilization system protein ParE [Garicola koreensis]
MSEYRLTPAAQRDLSSIWDFTEDRWGVGQAEKYVREFQSAIERVAEDPGLLRILTNRDLVRPRRSIATPRDSSPSTSPSGR